MDDAEQNPAAEAAVEDEDYEEEPELIQVIIKDTFSLGLCFGLGFGLAVIIYGLIALAVAKTILVELLR